MYLDFFDKDFFKLSEFVARYFFEAGYKNFLKTIKK